MKDNRKIWENIYGLGQQQNKYPYGDLPSHIFTHYGKNTDKSNLKVLEVGSGGGGNLWFFAREGFQTYGLEFSAPAVKSSQALLASDGLTAEISEGDFRFLPYADNFFDLVLDRNSLYCVVKKDLRQAVAEIRRVLKPGGRFLSYMYSAASDCLKYGHPKKIEENTYTDFQTRPFKNAGLTHFVTEKELREEIYQDFKVEYIRQTSNDFIYPKKYNDIIIFITSGIKQ
jgi:SAM-dependent methyltransferase